MVTAPTDAGVLRRPRLLDWLDEALTRRLTLLVAGAGYGKTTLLRSWKPPAPVLWPAVGRRQPTLPALLQALTSSFSPYLPGRTADLLAAGSASGPDATARAEAAAAVLCDVLAQHVDDDLVLVLDEAGQLGTEATRFVEALVREAPASLHLVIASRTDVPYPVHRLAARGQVLELTGVNLAFTAEESAAVIGGLVPDDDGTLAAALHAATGGWPVAVRLAAEAVRTQPPAARAATVAGLYRPGSTLFDFLAEEVLAQEPPATQELLRTVGVLPRFVGELCRDLELEDAAVVLGSLARRGVFVVPDASHPGWLRLTGLARQLVAQRMPLPPQRRAAVLATSAAWYEREGHLEDALATWTDAGDLDAVAALLRTHGSALLSAGAVDDVVAAVRALPATHRDTMIEQLAGEAHQVRGAWDEALRHFRRAAGAEPTLRSGLAWRMGVIHYLRGELDEALEVFGRADGSGDPADRALLHAWAASAYWLKGQPEPCADLAEQALTAAQEADDPRALAAAHTVLAMLAALRSDRAGNAAHYAHALAEAERAGDVLQIIRIRSNRASLHLEEGSYQEALRDVEAALRLSGVAGYGAYHALALTNRGETYLRLGRLEDALADLEAAKGAYQQLGSRMIAYPLGQIGDVHAERGDMSLAQGAYEEAVAHAEAAGDAQGLVSPLAGLAIVLAATDPEEARRLADRAVAQGEQMGQVRALLALGHVAAATGDSGGARAAGERAAAVARHRRDRAGLAEALVLIGNVEADAGRARGVLEEAVAIWRALDSPLGAAWAQLGLARRLVATDAVAARSLAEQVAATAGVHGARGLAAHAGAITASLDRRARATLVIRTLGGFRVAVDGTAIRPSSWPSREARELLKVLVAHRGRPASHSVLAAALRDGAQDPASRVADLVAALRATLDPQDDVAADRYVVTDGDTVRIEAAAVEIDVESFLADAAAGLDAPDSKEGAALLIRAEAAYTGDFLEENRNEGWTAALREEARTIYIAVARALADRHVDAGEPERAGRYLQRLLERDPYDESAHLALVSCLWAAGRPAEARRRYGSYRERIEELRLEPAPFPTLQDAPPQHQVAAETGMLRREGDLWLVSYRGVQARLRHSRGLEHLAVLLARPGREIHAVELAGGRDPASRGAPTDAEAGLRTGDGGLPVLDEQAKAAYRSRLVDLQDDLTEAEHFGDGERAARAREEIEALTSELAAAVGLGGRDRAVGSTAERARQATSKAIKVALARIGEALPALGEHLTTTVRTGTYCSYSPDPRAPLHWEL